MKKSSEESYGPKEAAHRFDTALKRMLSTPHKPHTPIGKKAKRAGRKRAAKPKSA